MALLHLEQIYSCCRTGRADSSDVSLTDKEVVDAPVKQPL